MPQIKIAKFVHNVRHSHSKKTAKARKEQKKREKRKKETKKLLESLFVPTTFYVNADAESRFPHDRKKTKKKKEEGFESTNRGFVAKTLTLLKF